jgi:molybdopterin synthase catalytic subunit
MSDAVRLLDIRHTPLDISEVYDAVCDDASGGIALFVGTVRDHDQGRTVSSLGYSAHPSAELMLKSVVDEVVAQHPVRAVAAVHRVGDLSIGDIAVVVAVACGHRGDAFAACRQLIDELKSRVPIWKHQVFADGDDEWVGTP